jgi:Trk-type K+ transport system membrane component
VSSSEQYSSDMEPEREESAPDTFSTLANAQDSRDVGSYASVAAEDESQMEEHKTDITGLHQRHAFVNRNGAEESYLAIAMSNVDLIEKQIGAVIDDERELYKSELQETLLGHRTFHIAWTVYVVLVSFGGGVMISAAMGCPLIDGWFTATSATVNAGLSVIEVHRIPKGVFAIIAWLMLLGSSSIMALPTMLYRCHKLRPFMHQIEKHLRLNVASESDKKLLRDYKDVYHASLFCSAAVIVYMLLWILFGSLFLYAGLKTRPMEEELQKRGFSHYQRAIFLAISAYTNSGLSLSSNGLVYVGSNSATVFWICALILGGNVMMPIFLRWQIVLMYRIARFMNRLDIASAAKYVIENPRRITTILYSRRDTFYLLQVAVMWNIFTFLYFLISCIYRDSLKKYGETPILAGLGLFQIINFRHAGFQVFNLRDWPQDMLLISAVAMFLSPVPGIGVLHRTGFTIFVMSTIA